MHAVTLVLYILYDTVYVLCMTLYVLCVVCVLCMTLYVCVCVLCMTLYVLCMHVYNISMSVPMFVCWRMHIIYLLVQCKSCKRFALVFQSCEQM